MSTKTLPVAAVIIDIEGTTTDIKFVHQVLFPFARKYLSEFVRQQRLQPEVIAIITAVKSQLPAEATLTQVIDLLHQWMDEDKKATSLKTVQGLIWQSGYDSGELKGHLYPDVLPVLEQWHDQGICLGVYSSGSVAAQKLLYGNSECGDITPLFSHYFDTRVGHKQHSASYRHIAENMAMAAAQLLFLSDSVAELDAAKLAGWHTIQLHRDGQATGTHPVVGSFAQINLSVIGATA